MLNSESVFEEQLKERANNEIKREDEVPELEYDGRGRACKTSGGFSEEGQVSLRKAVALADNTSWCCSLRSRGLTSRGRSTWPARSSSNAE